MGYDCTFHLIDEKAIHDIFVPKLLGKIDGHSALEKVMPKGQDLWKTTREAIAGDDPEAGAAAVCQLAVIFSACSLPYHYERGLALSLWPSMEGEEAGELPAEFIGPTVNLFSDIVEAFPRLKNYFYNEMTGNYSTGIYISSGNVPKAFSWLQKEIQKRPRGLQKRFRGLLHILEQATKRGLAYWEATDLAVPMLNQAAGDPSLMTADFLKNTKTPRTEGVASSIGETVRYPSEIPKIETVIGRGDGRMVLEKVFGRDSLFVDCSQWPPVMHFLKGVSMAFAARSQDGRWLVCSYTSERKQRLWILNSDPISLEDGLELKVDETLKPLFMEWRSGGFIGSQAIIFPERVTTDNRNNVSPEVQQLVDQGRKYLVKPWIQAAANSALLQLREEFDLAQYPREMNIPKAIRLGNKNSLVLWAGDGYEQDGATFSKVFLLSPDLRDRQLYDALPWGQDSFFYLHYGQLFEARRDKTLVRHLPKLDKFSKIFDGPPGAILLSGGGDIGALYFPSEMSVIYLESETFGLDLDEVIVAVDWASDRLILYCKDYLIGIPSQYILKMQQYDAITGRKKRNKT